MFRESQSMWPVLDSPSSGITKYQPERLQRGLGHFQSSRQQLQSRIPQVVVA